MLFRSLGFPSDVRRVGFGEEVRVGKRDRRDRRTRSEVVENGAAHFLCDEILLSEFPSKGPVHLIEHCTLFWPLELFPYSSLVLTKSRKRECGEEGMRGVLVRLPRGGSVTKKVF